jgi:hypothetical protein
MTTERKHYDFDGTNWVPLKINDDGSMLVGFRGQTSFDSPIVYAPYISMTREEREIYEAIHGNPPIQHSGSKIQLL